MMELIVPMLAAGVTAAVYGGYAYLTGKLGGTVGDFDTQKLMGTVVVGFIVGFVAAYMGMPMNEATIVSILVTIGAVEVGQKLLKPIYNALAKYFGK